jgi:hypothetical protein
MSCVFTLSTADLALAPVCSVLFTAVIPHYNTIQSSALSVTTLCQLQQVDIFIESEPV